MTGLDNCLAGYERGYSKASPPHEDQAWAGHAQAAVVMRHDGDDVQCRLKDCTGMLEACKGILNLARRAHSAVVGQPPPVMQVLAIKGCASPTIEIWGAVYREGVQTAPAHAHAYAMNIL